MKEPVISLLTDFGIDDNYVGVMKGVMLNILPETRFLDLTHQIPPQGVREAAYSLMTAFPYLPRGIVHLVVVDPGVGGARKAVAVESSQGSFIAPDNGVLSYLLPEIGDFRAVELNNPAYQISPVSSTFHGRDIFSPAAAHLAAGVALEELGPPVENLVTLPRPRLVIEEGRIRGEILSVDHFGNLATSISSLRWVGEDTLVLDPLWGTPEQIREPVHFSAAKSEVQVGDLNLKGIHSTFSSVELGEAVALVGSDWTLDLSLNQGSLARELDAAPGDPVTLIMG